MSGTWVWRALLIGLSLSMTVFSGCDGIQKQTHSQEPSEDTIVVSRRHDPSDETMVRVYSLRGIGLKDAPPEEIRVFMDNMRKMVVSKSWDRTASAVQVFGVLMTIRTTPLNHLRIEQYLTEVRKVMQQQPLSMGNAMR